MFTFIIHDSLALLILVLQTSHTIIIAIIL